MTKSSYPIYQIPQTDMVRNQGVILYKGGDRRMT